MALFKSLMGNIFRSAWRASGWWCELYRGSDVCMAPGPTCSITGALSRLMSSEPLLYGSAAVPRLPGNLVASEVGERLHQCPGALVMSSCLSSQACTSDDWHGEWTWAPGSWPAVPLPPHTCFLMGLCLKCLSAWSLSRMRMGPLTRTSGNRQIRTWDSLVTLSWAHCLFYLTGYWSKESETISWGSREAFLLCFVCKIW